MTFDKCSVLLPYSLYERGLFFRGFFFLDTNAVLQTPLSRFRPVSSVHTPPTRSCHVSSKFKKTRNSAGALLGHWRHTYGRLPPTTSSPIPFNRRNFLSFLDLHSGRAETAYFFSVRFFFVFHRGHRLHASRREILFFHRTRSTERERQVGTLFCTRNISSILSFLYGACSRSPRFFPCSSNPSSSSSLSVNSDTA